MEYTISAVCIDGLARCCWARYAFVACAMMTACYLYVFLSRLIRFLVECTCYPQGIENDRKNTKCPPYLIHDHLLVGLWPILVQHRSILLERCLWCIISGLTMSSSLPIRTAIHRMSSISFLGNAILRIHRCVTRKKHYVPKTFTSEETSLLSISFLKRLGRIILEWLTWIESSLPLKRPSNSCQYRDQIVRDHRTQL